VLEHHFSVPVDADFVIGHLYSTLPQGQLPDDRRDQFAAGVRAALRPHTTPRGGLVQDVPVKALVGRRSMG
jgi:hypothetical protein